MAVLEDPEEAEVGASEGGRNQEQSFIDDWNNIVLD